MKPLLLCVTYTAKPGMREQFVSEVTSGGLLETVRREDGCLGYAYYYSACNRDEILLLESWASEEQQKLHMGQAHMQTLKAIKDRYIIHTDVKRAFAEEA